MEIGKGFLEHLKRTSEERSVHEFARAGESITSGFTHLRLRGTEGENVYFVWNGKKYYSFMSEDEMYKTLCGKTKEEYLQSEKVLKSLTEENRERDLKACKDARKYKFSDWSWEVTSSFPQEIAQLILKGTESSLGCGNTGTIERMDTMVQLLKIAREGTPEEAQAAYRAIKTNPENRLYNYGVLTQSRYGEVFVEPVKEDVIVDCENHEPTIKLRMEKIMDDIKATKKWYEMQSKPRQPGED